MGILLESDTYIELLLRKALIAAQIPFQEQYRLYDGQHLEYVKFVADFLITNANTRLIVECDGDTYHTGKTNKKREISRDEWLKKKGYKVLHFSTYSLEHEMGLVLQTIKYHLGLSSELPKIIKKQSFYQSVSFDVELFCYYFQTPKGVVAVYKFKDCKSNQWSEERKKECIGVPDELIGTVAIYLALLDLKKPVRIKIYYLGRTNAEDFSVAINFRKRVRKLSAGGKILNRNYIAMEYVKQTENFHRSTKNPQATMKELRSRCYQLCAHKGDTTDITSYKYDDIKERR